MNLQKELVDALDQITDASNLVDDAVVRFGVPECYEHYRWLIKLRLLIKFFDQKQNPQPDLATIAYQSNTIQRLAVANGAMQLALEHALLAINTNTELGVKVDEMIRRALEIQKESRL